VFLRRILRGRQEPSTWLMSEPRSALENTSIPHNSSHNMSKARKTASNSLLRAPEHFLNASARRALQKPRLHDFRTRKLCTTRVQSVATPRQRTGAVGGAFGQRLQLVSATHAS
jgi:hypothetical protein